MRFGCEQEGRVEGSLFVPLVAFCSSPKPVLILLTGEVIFVIHMSLNGIIGTSNWNRTLLGMGLRLPIRTGHLILTQIVPEAWVMM